MKYSAVIQDTGPGKKLLSHAGFKAAAAVAAGSLLLASAGVVYADAISNNLDGTFDSVAEIMPLNLGGPAGSTTLYVVKIQGDGNNGCTIQGREAVSLSLASSNTAVATVTPSSATFGSCGDTTLITVTPVGVGTASVTAALTGNTTDDVYDVAPVNFSVKVTAPAPSNTAPIISISGVTPGASYAKGSVPTTVCNVTDAEDGSSSPSATLSAITGPAAADGIGSQTASCSYTDGGGLTASSSVTYNIVDVTAPEISYTLSPATADGLAGWYRSSVELKWTVTESDSPTTLSKVGCEDQTVTLDQLPADYSCSATSSGGSVGPVTVPIKKDGTAPTVSSDGASGTLGNDGWYVSDVLARFAATDATSGPASATQSVTSSGEGSAIAVLSPAFTDNAGNTTAAGTATQTFKIDKTAPTVAFSSTVDTGYFGSTAPAPECVGSDAVSGLASCVVSGYGIGVGTHTLTATATDVAGNTATATQTYTVLAWTLKGFYQPIDMGGVLNTVKGGSTVPAKFEVFAGNTEITDPGLMSFSMAKISCSPVVPTDEIETTATGSTSLRYDATAGQFVYNWKTPTGAGTCYRLTMLAADGSTISANFKLK
ncbi:MAG TPA: PxKF domain-containing protein [Arthrobacter sp.]|nr:PxKF domain-containing protein [Arthrobacter sp.]